MVPLQNIRELANLPVQLLIRQRYLLARLPFPDQGGLVPRGSCQVPVQTVLRNIELAANEPLGERLVPPRISPDSLSIYDIAPDTPPSSIYAPFLKNPSSV